VRKIICVDIAIDLPEVAKDCVSYYLDANDQISRP
jgi:hypothetical protein